MTLAYVRSQQSECLMYKCSYNIIYVDSACLWYQPLYSVVVGIILLSNQCFQCTLLFPITSHQFIHQFISPTVYICLCLTKCDWEQEYICLSVSMMSDKSRRFVTIHVYAWLRARVCFCLSVSVFSDQSHCIVTIPVTMRMRVKQMQHTKPTSLVAFTYAYITIMSFNTSLVHLCASRSWKHDWGLFVLLRCPTLVPFSCVLHFNLIRTVFHIFTVFYSI